jgi:hypothetical protein
MAFAGGRGAERDAPVGNLLLHFIPYSQTFDAQTFAIPRAKFRPSALRKSLICRIAVHYNASSSGQMVPRLDLNKRTPIRH